MERADQWTVRHRAKNGDTRFQNDATVPARCPVTSEVCEFLIATPVAHSLEENDIAGRLTCAHGNIPRHLVKLLREPFASWVVEPNRDLKVYLHRPDYVCPKRKRL